MRTIRIIDENDSYLQVIFSRNTNFYDFLGLPLYLHGLQP